MLSKLSLRQKALILLILPLVFLTVSIAALIVSFSHAEEEARHIRKSWQAMQQTKRLLSDCSEGLYFVFRADLAQPHPDLSALERSLQAFDDIEKQLSDKEFPELSAVVEAIKNLREPVSKWSAEVKKIVSDTKIAPEQRRRLLTRRAMLDIATDMRNLDRLVIKIETENVKDTLEQQQKTNRTLKIIFCLSVALTAMFSALLLFYYNIDFVEALEQIRDNALSAARNAPLIHRRLGTDELAQLDGILHDRAQTFSHLIQLENSILDNSADIICSLDSKLRFLKLNRAVQSIGFEPAELLGTSFANICVSPTIHALTLELAPTSSETRNEKTVHIQLKTKNGQIKTFECNSAWSSESNLFNWVLRDISAQEQIRQFKNIALALVAHDLKSPLVTCLFSLDKLLDTTDPKLSNDDESRALLVRDELSFLKERCLGLGSILKLQHSPRIPVDVISLNELCAEIVTEHNARSEVSSFSSPVGDALIRADYEELLRVITEAYKDIAQKLTVAEETGRQARIIDTLIKRDGDFAIIDLVVPRSLTQLSAADSNLVLSLLDLQLRLHGGNLKLIQSQTSTSLRLQIPRAGAGDNI